MRPMLATPGRQVPTGGEWTHEVKWDGVRILADVTGGGAARFHSRNGNVVSAAWPDLVPAPLGDRDLLVDGEIIALNEQGLPDFRVLQKRMHVRKRVQALRLAEAVPATYMVFDLLRLDGADLAGRPLAERRELLDGLGIDTGWQVPAGRRRADALRRHPAAGARGHRQQAARLALPVR